MKLLVLGAAGQIGHELCRRVWPADYRIAGVDRAEVDITRQEAVAATLRQERPDIVINAAAYTAVDRAESKPDVAWAVNAAGTRHRAHGMGLQRAGPQFCQDDVAARRRPPGVARRRRPDRLADQRRRC